MAISQDQMVAKLKALPDEERPHDISKSSISRWETDQKTPPVEYLVFLSRHTGRQPGWFITGGKEHPAAIRLQVIGKVVDGTLDNETVKRLAAISKDEDPNTGPLEDGLGDLGEGDGEDDDDAA